jgi:hypothetical protein
MFLIFVSNALPLVTVANQQVLIVPVVIIRQYLLISSQPLILVSFNAQMDIILIHLKYAEYAIRIVLLAQ